VTENPDALWQNVSKCISNEANHGDPYPCLGVDLSLGQDKGFALLKDCVGVGQVLLIPTQKITGIESPEILRDKAGHEPRNYFAEAWRARSILDALVHKDLPRDAISLAINSKCHRTQRQLHIHIDCVRPDVEKALAKQKIGYQWAKLGAQLLNQDYMARRVDGDDAGDLGLKDNPFDLAKELDGASDKMAERTLVVIGATSENRKPGFIILESQFDPKTHNRAHGEDLQDHYCSIAWKSK
jgi:CDP-diacylglycerol pyrophosphatase